MDDLGTLCAILLMGLIFSGLGDRLRSRGRWADRAVRGFALVACALMLAGLLGYRVALPGMGGVLRPLLLIGSVMVIMALWNRVGSGSAAGSEQR